MQPGSTKLHTELPDKGWKDCYLGGKWNDETVLMSKTLVIARPWWMMVNNWSLWWMMNDYGCNLWIINLTGIDYSCYDSGCHDYGCHDYGCCYYGYDVGSTMYTKHNDTTCQTTTRMEKQRTAGLLLHEAYFSLKNFDVAILLLLGMPDSMHNPVNHQPSDSPCTNQVV